MSNEQSTPAPSPISWPQSLPQETMRKSIHYSKQCRKASKRAPRNSVRTSQSAVFIGTLLMCYPNSQRCLLLSSEKTTRSSPEMALAEAAEASDEMYCGSSWLDAFENCHEPCPSGEDSECSDQSWSCQVYTGCASKLGIYGEDNGDPEEGDNLDPYENNFCGVDWIDAMLKCSDPCPPGQRCPEGLFCYAATGCNKPLESHESRLVLSLFGADRVMRGDEPTILEELIKSFLKLELEANKVAVNQAEMTKQEAIAEKLYDGLGRDRALIEFYDYQLQDSLGDSLERNPHEISHNNYHNIHGDMKAQTNFRWSSINVPNNDEMISSQGTSKFSDSPHNNEKRRQLPTTSSALDVSMVVTGDYRPPPYLDLDTIIEDSINRASARLVTDLRERGRRAGTDVFDRLEAVRVVAEERATARPTPKPTLSPTETPTLGPTVDPTSSPTASPTLPLEQTLQIGIGEDLYNATGRAFGNIFEIKTRRNSPTIVIQGFDIYTAAPAGSRLFYTIWTTEGPWLGFDGKLDSYTKVAEGEVISAGECVQNEQVEVNDFTDSSNTTSFADGGSVTGDNSTNTTTSLDKEQNVTNASISENTFSLDDGEDVTASMTAKTKSFGEMKCNFTQIPLAHFQPVHILGNGKSRSFYITLRSRDMIFSPGSGTDGDTDFKVINSSPEIEVFEGAVGFIYLFGQEIDSAISFSSFRMPRGFLGQVHYHRNPCLDGSADIWPCETRAPVTTFQLTTQKPTLSPTSLPSTSHAPTLEPSVRESEIEVDNDDFDDDTIPKVLKTYDFIRVPTEHGNATAVSNYSFYEPEDLHSTYIILTLESVPRSVMNEREFLRYESVLLGYIREQEVLSNVLLDAVSLQMWHQAIVVEEIKKKKPKQTISSSRNKYRAKSRKLQEFTYVNPSTINANNEDIETTIIIQSTHSTLPSSTASKLLLHVMESPESTLINDLHDQKIFFSYFKDIDTIHGRLIDRVTPSPTSSPTSYAHFLSMEEEAIEKKPLFMMTLISAVGLCIGALWCLLTTITVWYLIRARTDMINDKKLYRLAKKGKITDVDDLESGEISGIDDMKAILEDGTCVSQVTDSLNGSSLTLDHNLSDGALDNSSAERNSSVDNNLNDSVNKRLNELLEKIETNELYELDASNKHPKLLKSLVIKPQERDLLKDENEVLESQALQRNCISEETRYLRSTSVDNAAVVVKSKNETSTRRSSGARMNRQLSSSDIVMTDARKEMVTCSAEHKRSSSLVMKTECGRSLDDGQFVSISRHLRKKSGMSFALGSSPIIDAAAAASRRGTNPKRRSSKEGVLHTKVSSRNTSVKFSADTDFVKSDSNHVRSKSLELNPSERSSPAQDGKVLDFAKIKRANETRRSLTGRVNLKEEGCGTAVKFSLNTQFIRSDSKRKRSKSVDVKPHNDGSPSEGKLVRSTNNLQKQDKSKRRSSISSPSSDAAVRKKQEKDSSLHSLRERVNAKETETTAALTFFVNKECIRSDSKNKPSNSLDTTGREFGSRGTPSTKDRVKEGRAKSTEPPISDKSERRKPALDGFTAHHHNGSLSIRDKIRTLSNDKFVNILDNNKKYTRDPNFVIDYITGSSTTNEQSAAPLLLSSEAGLSRNISKGVVVNPSPNSSAVEPNSMKLSESVVFKRAAKATQEPIPAKISNNMSQRKDFVLFGGQLNGRRTSLDDARHALTRDTNPKATSRPERTNTGNRRVSRHDESKTLAR